jgi:hypothetical protein
MKKLIISILLCCAALVAQETVDHANAVKVLPWTMRPDFPGICVAGQRMTLTSGSYGSNDYVCGTHNNWISVGVSSGTTTSTPGVGTGSVTLYDAGGLLRTIIAAPDTLSSNYATVLPTVPPTDGQIKTYTAPVGSGATAGTITLSSGGIASIPVTAGGSGYGTTPPLVSFDGDGTGAKATAVLSAGSVVSVTVDAPGQNYSQATATFVPVSVESFTTPASGGATPAGSNGDLQKKNGTALAASGINDDGTTISIPARTVAIGTTFPVTIGDSVSGISGPIATTSKIGGVLLSGLSGLIKMTAGVPAVAAAGDIPNIAESQVTNLVSDLGGKASSTATLTVNGTTCTLGASCAPIPLIPSSISTSGPVSDPGGNAAFQYNNASGALTFNLPAGVAGMQRCYRNATGKSGAITIAVTTSNSIDLNGANGTTSTGTLVSSGALGDAVCLQSDAANHWYAYVSSGSWTNN